MAEPRLLVLPDPKLWLSNMQHTYTHIPIHTPSPPTHIQIYLKQDLSIQYPRFTLKSWWSSFCGLLIAGITDIKYHARLILLHLNNASILFVNPLIAMWGVIREVRSLESSDSGPPGSRALACRLCSQPCLFLPEGLQSLSMLWAGNSRSCERFCWKPWPWWV